MVEIKADSGGVVPFTQFICYGTADETVEECQNCPGLKPCLEIVKKNKVK